MFYNLIIMCYAGIAVCEFQWKTPVHSTEVDYLGYHPYVQISREIDEILLNKSSRICDQDLERICNYNKRGDLVNIEFSSADSLFVEVFKIISFHSEAFLRVILNIANNALTPYMHPNKLILHLDPYGEHKRPLLSSNTHLTAMLVVFAPPLGEDGNTLFLIDPRTQPANNVLGDNPGAMPYDLEQGRVVVFPSYLRWYLLPNSDIESLRIYFLIEFTIIPEKFEFCQFPRIQIVPSELDPYFHYYRAINGSPYIDWIWGTPIEQYHSPILAGLGESLREYVLKMEKDEGVVKSNRGGWQSKSTQMKGSNKILEIIQTEIRDVVSKFLTTGIELETHHSEENILIPHMWFGINRNLDSNVIHVHPGTHISGVYYVDSGHEGGRACIHHVDPRPQATVLFGELEKNKGLIKTCVEAGNFVLFPSWLEHFVEPLMNLDRPRIMLSFNVMIRDNEYTHYHDRKAQRS